MKKKSLKSLSKTGGKAVSKFEKKFGGLKKHDIKIQPINVFALKIEYLEEGPAPAPFIPIC